MKEHLKRLIATYRIMAQITQAGEPYASSVYTMIADDIQEVIDND